jgi:hypothetical protein
MVRRQSGYDRQPTFQELLHKRSMGPISIAQQRTQHMRLLLPKVHRFLVILPTLVDQNIDQLRVRHIAILLKAVANNGAYCRGRDVEGV